jgi:hypothetical protein
VRSAFLIIWPTALGFLTLIQSGEWRSGGGPRRPSCAHSTFWSSSPHCTDRMPVILAPGDYDRWLADDRTRPTSSGRILWTTW